MRVDEFEDCLSVGAGLPGEDGFLERPIMKSVKGDKNEKKYWGKGFCNACDYGGAVSRCCSH